MIRRTLMQRNRELIDFEVDPATGEARVVDASEAGKDLLASLGSAQQSADRVLTGLIKSRTVLPQRPDKEDILAAFGAKSVVHLALMGHGLSLSDQFWYRAPGSAERWEDINVFDNEWDPGFGAAVLGRDYARLATCSPDVPDTTTSGRAIKAWERSGDGIFLIKESLLPDGADLQGVKLASDLCALLFDESCFVPATIVERYGKPYSASPLMLAPDEEFVDGNRLCAMAGIQEKRREQVITTELCESRIDAYKAIGITDASAHVAKLACCSCLALLADFHAGNIGAIRKVDSDVWRAAPIFDFDGSFGFNGNMNELPAVYTNPKLAQLFCIYTFSYLDPSWDWSWYDPQALEGFEDRIREAYAPLLNVPPHLGELTAHMFVAQRKYVNKIALAQ